MPFQPINFAAIDPLGKPWAANFAKNLQEGMNTYNLPQKLMGEREQMALANALQRENVQQAQMKTPFTSQQEEADLMYKIARAKAAEQQSNMPFGGQLSGVAREAFGLELLKQQFGADSEVYKNAAKRYQADLDASNVLNHYRQTLAGSTDKRASTALGKTEMEISDILNRQDISPDEKRAILGRYQLSRQKQISDQDARKRALFASNVDKTLDNINPKDLVQYGGVKGQAKLQVDKLKAATGNATKEYIKYQDALTGAKLLSKQIRQFYGDSITPQVQEQLAEMVNPATWANNPEVALKKFNRFKNILQSETETYRNALKDTKEFNSSDQKENNMQLLKKQRAMAEALKKQQPSMIGEDKNKSANPVKRFKYINGAWVNA